MSTIRPTTVEVETSLRLVAPDATALPVRASLRYDPADPYAVHVLFHAESAGGEAVSWSFERELLDPAAHLATVERPGAVAALLLDHLGARGTLATGFATRP